MNWTDLAVKYLVPGIVVLLSVLSILVRMMKPRPVGTVESSASRKIQKEEAKDAKESQEASKIVGANPAATAVNFDKTLEGK